MFVSFRGDCKRFGQPHFFLIRESIKMVSLVEEQVTEPVVVKKNKKNKKRKLEAENDATPLVGCFRLFSPFSTGFLW